MGAGEQEDGVQADGDCVTGAADEVSGDGVAVDQDEVEHVDRADASEDDNSRDGGARDGIKGVSEAVWRSVMQGLRSVASTTEDRISGALGDSVPKDMAREVAGYIRRQVDTGREEIVSLVGKQVNRFLDNVDLGGELKKALTSLSFEIRTEVRFIPNEHSVKPDAKVRVKIKPTADDTEESLAKSLFRRTVDKALGAFRDEDEDLEPGEGTSDDGVTD